MMRFLGLVAVVVAVAGATAGCGSASDAHRRQGIVLARQGKTAEAIAELRLAVAAEPRDAEAHAELGRLEVKAGRPGAALRELDRATYYGDGGVKKELARLLVDRARARALRGEAHRWRDLDRAGRLDRGVRKEVAGELEAARADGDHADAMAAGTTADTGGAGASVGAGVGAGAARAGVEVGVEEVLVAATEAWLAGEREVWIDAELAAQVIRLAGERRDDQIAAWARPTIDRLRGDSGSLLEALAQAGEPAGGAGALLALEAALAGDLDRARRIVGQPAGGELSVRLAALTIGELTGDQHPELYAAVAALPDGAAALARRGDVAPLIATRGAHPDIEKRVGRWWLLSARLPAGAAQPILARWRKVIAPDALAAWQEGADAGTVEELGSATRGLPPAWAGCPDTAERRARLAEVLHAIAGDLAAGEQAARDYVDIDVSTICRAGDMARVFAAAGDARRALAWTGEMLAVEPGEWRASLLAAQVTARAHDAPRAGQYLVDAEYWASSRGLPSIVLSRTYAETGLAVEAIGAARQALSLADGPLAGEAAEQLVVASLAAGRSDDALRVWTETAGKLPAAQQAAARARIRAQADGAGVATDGVAWLAGDADQPAGDAALLDQTLRWAPGAVAPRLARARLEAPDSPRRLELMSELLLIGVLDDGPRGAAALDAFADLADASTDAKVQALATGARAEAASLLRFTR